MAGKSALPLLALAGAAAVLMSGKKKKRKSSAGADYESFVVPPTPPPPAATKTAGPSGESAGSDIWKQRQTALAFVAGMKVCNCHPGNIDGLYGPATINAIIAFQVCTDIGVDGKWGPQTDAAMKKMLAQIAGGQVYIKVPKKNTSDTMPSPGQESENAKIDIKNNTVITSSGNRFKLTTWVPENMMFPSIAFRKMRPADRVAPHGVKIDINAWRKQEGHKKFGDYGPHSFETRNFTTLAEAVRKVAIHFPNVNFVAGIGKPSFAGCKIKMYAVTDGISLDNLAWSHFPVTAEFDCEWRTERAVNYYYNIILGHLTALHESGAIDLQEQA